MNDQNRPMFIKKLVSFIQDNELDGIDIDIEGDVINNYLGDFMQDLSDTCHKRGWEVTAAWPAQGMWADKVSDKALENVDYVYIMSYDNKGPWDPSDPGQHAPYDKSIVDIIGLDKEAAEKDQIGKLWYNGQPMMRKKTQLAIEKGIGGMMIWEITQDIPGKKSLLNALYSASLPALCSDHSITYEISDKNVTISNLPDDNIIAITLLNENNILKKVFTSKKIKINNDSIKLNIKKSKGKTLVIRTKSRHFQIYLK